MDRWLTNSPVVVAERAKIVRLWLQGATARDISQETGASLSTVYRWVRRWQQEGTVKARTFHKKPQKNTWFKGRGNILKEATVLPETSARAQSQENIKEIQAFLAPQVCVHNEILSTMNSFRPVYHSNNSLYESYDFKEHCYPFNICSYNQYFLILMHIYSQLANK